MKYRYSSLMFCITNYFRIIQKEAERIVTPVHHSRPPSAKKKFFKDGSSSRKKTNTLFKLKNKLEFNDSKSKGL